MTVDEKRLQRDLDPTVLPDPESGLFRAPSGEARSSNFFAVAMA